MPHTSWLLFLRPTPLCTRLHSYRAKVHNCLPLYADSKSAEYQKNMFSILSPRPKTFPYLTSLWKNPRHHRLSIPSSLTILMLSKYEFFSSESSPPVLLKCFSNIQLKPSCPPFFIYFFPFMVKATSGNERNLKLPIRMHRYNRHKAETQPVSVFSHP